MKIGLMTLNGHIHIMDNNTIESLPQVDGCYLLRLSTPKTFSRKLTFIWNYGGQVALLLRKINEIEELVIYKGELVLIENN
jgi:hypothetical protein